MQLTPKQVQQKLFDDANAALQNSFYRHGINPDQNENNLNAFQNGLSTVENKPKPPLQQTILYSVREVQNKDKSYSYEVYLPGEPLGVASYDDIKDAYAKSNSLNQNPVIRIIPCE